MKDLKASASEVNQRLHEISDSLSGDVHLDVTGLENAARQSASMLRSTAARAHDKVGVRIVRRGDGIRVTLTGPAAGKYRAFMAADLARRAPDAAAEIRTQITRRIK